MSHIVGWYLSLSFFFPQKKLLPFSHFLNLTMCLGLSGNFMLHSSEANTAVALTAWARIRDTSKCQEQCDAPEWRAHADDSPPQDLMGTPKEAGRGTSASLTVIDESESVTYMIMLMISAKTGEHYWHGGGCWWQRWVRGLAQSEFICVWSDLLIKK